MKHTASELSMSWLIWLSRRLAVPAITSNTISAHGAALRPVRLFPYRFGKQEEYGTIN
jgi:hypothetical protein